jgi:hypothetical protein
MSTATVNATLDAAADDLLAAPITAPEHEDDRPAGQAVFAAFCYEDPDSFIGRYVSQTAADLAENGTTVYLFARRPFPGDEPGVRTHVVGECPGEGILGSVQEFTRRAANAFLRQFPAGTEGGSPCWATNGRPCRPCRSCTQSATSRRSRRSTPSNGSAAT